MKFSIACAVLAGLLLPAAAWAEPAADSASSQPAVVRGVFPEVTVKDPQRSLLKIEERRLDNGIPVYIVERPKLPIEEVLFSFPEAGSENEPAGKYGLAYQLMHCLTRGAGERDALAFAEAADLQGADISPWGMYFDCMSLKLACISEKLPESLDLAADALISPAFAPRELKIQQKGYEELYLRWRSSPKYLPYFLFDRLLYGEASRYGTFRTGDSAQASALTRQDLLDYYGRHFRPEKMFICCCGSVKADEMAALLNKRIGRWSPAPYAAGESAEAEKTETAAAAKAEPRYIPADLPKDYTPPEVRLFVVDNPGASQSVIVAGGLGLSRNDPDYPAAEVMAGVLGGPFSSRLNTNLREKHGYTYGASSGLYSSLHHGRVRAQTDVQTDKTVPALQEMLKEIASMRQTVPEEELRRTIDYMAYGFPDKFKRINGINEFVYETVLYGFPKNYGDTYIAELRKITPEDVRLAAERILGPDKLLVVISGDAKAIEPQLKEAGLRARLLTADEVLGPKFISEKSL